MIPFILLALGLGAVAAYALSPGTHQWVDEHVSAVKDALRAHDQASANLDAARETTAATQVPGPRITSAEAMPAAPLPPVSAQIAAATTQVAISAQRALAAKKAAIAMGDHPVADVAHRVADLVAALTAAKADETEASAALMMIQSVGRGSGPDAQALQQRITTAQNRETVLRDQLALLGQTAGAALAQRGTAKAPARDPWA